MNPAERARVIAQQYLLDGNAEDDIRRALEQDERDRKAVAFKGLPTDDDPDGRLIAVRVLITPGQLAKVREDPTRFWRWVAADSLAFLEAAEQFSRENNPEGLPLFFEVPVDPAVLEI